MQIFRRPQTLNRHDLRFVRHPAHLHDTGSDNLAIHDDGTRAALPGAATDFAACQ